MLIRSAINISFVRSNLRVQEKTKNTTLYCIITSTKVANVYNKCPRIIRNPDTNTVINYSLIHTNLYIHSNADG